MSWKGDDIGYRAAHKRTKNSRGKAADYDCLGCSRRAEHWAYDHKDANEKWEVVSGQLVAFSTDIDHYMPLCRGCHVKYDRYDNHTLVGASRVRRDRQAGRPRKGDMKQGIVTCVACSEDCEIRWADLVSGDFYCSPECVADGWGD